MLSSNDLGSPISRLNPKGVYSIHIVQIDIHDKQLKVGRSVKVLDLRGMDMYASTELLIRRHKDYSLCISK